MDDTDRIKQAMPLEDIVADYTDLKQSGQYLKGKSPFTNENTPSFYVSPDKGLYHCFSSGQGGDVFTFVQEMEGIEFRESLEFLADRAGITLQGGGGNSGQKNRLRDIIAEAASFYQKKRGENSQIDSYLQSRGIRDSTADEFQLGFAPDSWRSVKRHLENDGFKTEDIEAAGLIKTSENAKNPYDRFRNRLMFPLSDSAGRVIAFSGRRMTEEQNAKYINSPETLLYKKSQVLFGYDKAKDTMREVDAAVIVEGQTDLLLSHQAGIRNTVASSGTAITKEQLKLIKRLTENIVFALDTDSAGKRSALKSARLALSLGMTAKIATLPDEKDPADIVSEEGGDALKKYIKNAEDAVVKAVAWTKEKASDRQSFLRALEGSTFPLLKAIDNNLTRDHFISEVSARADIREESLRSRLSNNRSSTPKRQAQKRKGGSVKKRDEKPLTRHERLEQIEKELATTLSFLKENSPDLLESSDLEKRIKEINTKRDKETLPDVDKDDLLAKEIRYNENKAGVKKNIEELLLHFDIAVLQSVHETAREKLRSDSEKESRRKLLKKCQDTAAEIQQARDALREIN